METQSVTPQPEPVTRKEKTKSRPAVVVLSVLFILALAGAGVLAYVTYGQSQTIKTAEAENERLAAQNTNANNGQSAGDNQPTGGKDMIDQSAVCAQALDTVEAFMSTNGVTRQQTECDIRYLDDTFARVNVNHMVPDESNGKTKPSGKGEVIYFKHVTRGAERSWAVIGINPLTTDEIQSLKNRYGVTDAVITTDKPA